MLALVGSGEYLKDMEKVDLDLMGRLPGPPKVVCLPTAAGREGPKRIDYWSRLGMNHFSHLGAEVEALPVIDKESANDSAMTHAVSKANFVYLSGGKPDYLYETLKDSLVWTSIVGVLEKGGLLAGCSAGAMILGEAFYGFPGWKAGFNFLPGMTIIPHFDEIPESMLESVRLTARDDLKLLGIERNTALIKNGERYEVVGSGGVTVWDNSRKDRYPAGLLKI
jgi:cyanophycinase